MYGGSLLVKTNYQIYATPVCMDKNWYNGGSERVKGKYFCNLQDVNKVPSLAPPPHLYFDEITKLVGMFIWPTEVDFSTLENVTNFPKIRDWGVLQKSLVQTPIRLYLVFKIMLKEN